jgi:alkaline phosphatase D
MQRGCLTLSFFVVACGSTGHRASTPEAAASGDGPRAADAAMAPAEADAGSTPVAPSPDAPVASEPGPPPPADAAVTLDAAPGQPAATIERIAFGSCNYVTADQSFWGRIVERRPQLFLALGDIIYVDHGEKYEQLAAVAGFKQLMAMVRPLVIWDDHDYGGNDTGGAFGDKAGAKKRFLDFWTQFGGVAADSPRRVRPGNYDAVIVGPPERAIQVVMLDNRSFKANPPGGSVLGDAQWTWLAEELRKPARLRIIMSGMEQISSSTTPEGWGLYLAEQQHLYDVIKAAGAKGAFIVSGDKHYAEISRRDVGLGYPLYDFTSSPMSAPPEPIEANKYRDAPGSIISDHNFGVITLDWNAPDPTVHVEIVHATKGNVLLEKMITLGQLGD